MLIHNTTMITPTWGFIENYKDNNVDEEIEKLKSKTFFSTKIDEEVKLELKHFLEHNILVNKEISLIEEDLKNLPESTTSIKISLNNIRMLCLELLEKI